MDASGFVQPNICTIKKCQKDQKRWFLVSYFRTVDLPSNPMFNQHIYWSDYSNITVACIL